MILIPAVVLATVISKWRETTRSSVRKSWPTSAGFSEGEGITLTLHAFQVRSRCTAITSVTLRMSSSSISVSSRMSVMASPEPPSSRSSKGESNACSNFAITLLCKGMRVNGTR